MPLARSTSREAKLRAEFSAFTGPTCGLTWEGLLHRAALLSCEELNTPRETLPKAIIIYVDADACPVKEEVYKVAFRYHLKVFIVANSYISVPSHPDVERTIVPAGADAADDWIVERAEEGDIVVTADVPLAARIVAKNAEAIGPSGRAFTSASIGMQLATRNLLQDLRDAGEITRGPRPFSPRDRSEFLQALDRTVNRLKRNGFVTG